MKVWLSFQPLYRCRLLCCSAEPFIKAMPKDLKRKSEEGVGYEAKRHAGHWANGLKQAIEDANLRFYTDDLVIVIKDKYPKAKFHYLVLPKEEISNLKNINKKHLELLEHMQQVGQEIADREEYKEVIFRMGYHAEPSMHYLHMHLISDDFCSDCLKTKKHYNSFTTDHFISSEKVIDSLRRCGKVLTPSPVECRQLLQLPLKCFKCSEKFITMPKLKEHLKLPCVRQK